MALKLVSSPPKNKGAFNLTSSDEFYGINDDIASEFIELKGRELLEKLVDLGLNHKNDSIKIDAISAFFKITLGDLD